MIFRIWNLLPLYFQRKIKKVYLKKNNKNISINNDSILDDFLLQDILTKKISLWEWVYLWKKDNNIFWKLSVWDYSFIWFPNNWIYSSLNFNIKIWKFCSVARNLFIINYNYHSINKISTSTSALSTKLLEENWGDVVILNDVWIWANVTILPWIHIWNWAIVWAGSVVTKNIPDYAIVWWNPAKIIKYRFSNSKIKKLLDLEWWNWTIEEIEKNYDLNFLNEH